MQALERNGIRLAATVMLLRDAEHGLQVYMVKRPGRGAFPDLHVFPGGKVDEDDFAPDLTQGLGDAAASALLGIAAGGLRYWVAVARECFEECGVLVVKGADEHDLNQLQRLNAYRRDLLAGNISFSEICRREALTIDTDLLGYFSHWITPEAAPRRFDTRFFVAAMPAQQVTLADTGETVEDAWISPAQALQHAVDDTWQMIDPTLRSLETLQQFSSVAEVLQGVRRADHLMPLTDALAQQGMQALR